MIGLFSERRRRPAPSWNRVQLRLESLEGRELPSTIIASSPSSTSGTQLTSQTSSSPLITSFTATQSYGNVWIFSGTVTDGGTPVAGLIINLGGLPSLQGKTCTVGSNGSFSIAIQLQSGEYGTATAQFTDWYGNSSNVASAQVNPPPPPVMN